MHSPWHRSKASGAYRAGRHEAGFTLLEVMVTLVVLGMIVTTAFGALRLGERSWEAGVARAGDTEIRRTVAGLLQRQFSQALPLAWTEGTKTRIAFDGERDTVRFLAPAPRQHSTSGLFEYTLAVNRQGNDTRLELRYQLHDPGGEGFRKDDRDEVKKLLVDGLRSAEFAYFGPRSDDDPPRWHREWHDDADNLPRLVRVRLVAGREQQPWPELLLALQTVKTP